MRSERTFYFSEMRGIIVCVCICVRKVQSLRKSILRLETKRAQVRSLLLLGRSYVDAVDFATSYAGRRLCVGLVSVVVTHQLGCCQSALRIGRVHCNGCFHQKYMESQAHIHARDTRSGHACTHVEREACLHTYSVGQTE